MYTRLVVLRRIHCRVQIHVKFWFLPHTSFNLNQRITLNHWLTRVYIEVEVIFTTRTAWSYVVFSTTCAFIFVDSKVPRKMHTAFPIKMSILLKQVKVDLTIIFKYVGPSLDLANIYSDSILLVYL